MSKKTFIALADKIRGTNALAEKQGMPAAFSYSAIQSLADFCAAQNPLFKRERWLDYIAGKCGQNGGKLAA